MSSDGSDYENYEPSPPPTKKAPAKRTKKAVAESDDDSVIVEKSKKQKTTKVSAKKTPLSEINDNMNGRDKVSAQSDDDFSDEEAVEKKKSNETASNTKYEKLTQLQHVLRRPDTYIGSIEMQEIPMWSYNSATQSMQHTKVNIVPGLYKIYDEILVNAADNKQRDPSMDTLKVEFDREANTVSVYNNGAGIPVEIHDKEKIWIPELIFGHLLTSSNYDDDQKKVTGGRNGFGAKLANIFSTEFVLETADKKNGKKYIQTWTENMSKISKAKITANKSMEYTKVTFKPDLAKFGMERMDDDLEAVFKRRVYDLAGTCPGVKVFLNGERIKIKNFKNYCEMYINSLPPADKPPALVYEKVNDRWEIGFTISDGQFNQVSFVNSIATTKGGKHVDHVTDQIVKSIVDAYEKKNKKAAKLKPFQVRSHCWVFINSLIENPAFDSQTKENMTLKQSSFGSKCTLSEEFLKKVLKSGIMDDIVKMSEARADKAAKKTDGSKRNRITGMAKLEDANKAGTREAERCTLILTEGDSAKTLAIAGMSVVGRDHFGVFPLRGKLLNVREASITQVNNNTEIQNIKQILGLKHNQKYESTKELRYGHLMIMTDQDHDGSHIKGLIINYLEHHYPTLLKIPGFLVEFITPIVRCTKGKEIHSFFTIPEYEFWKEQTNPGREWKIKYFKGLGTSDTADAKKYFSDLDMHLKEFHTIQDGDKELIELAFSKTKADERKEWLRNFKQGTFLDNSIAKIPISDFINKELILFSMADNIRSIPSMMDGFKPGQRKVLFACFKRKLKAEVKVAQLVGYIGEHTAYHHGEVSLSMTIVGLAQSFVGSNNINVLMPNGQFGTRHAGGKDAASARYIFTDLSKITRKIFPENDSPLLNYLNDDGLSIEPEWFAPVIPMILVNGTSGIGTGWSSSMPNFDPQDLVNNLRRLLDGEELQTMKPWYRGFKGPIREGKEAGNYRAEGIIEEIDDNTLHISELPIGFWTISMKEFLEKAISGDEKTPAWIKDYADNSTESSVSFTVTLMEGKMKECLKTGLLEKFKLIENISMKNLVAFDSENRIKKYGSVEEILMEFYHVRLSFYQKRKDWMVSDLERQYERLSNQARFVQMICNKELIVSNKKRTALVGELKSLNFASFPTKKSAIVAGETEDHQEENELDDPVAESTDHGYDYLLGMAIWSLTKEKVEKLLRDRSNKEAELHSLLKLSAKDIWRSDLSAFEEEWHKMLEADQILASEKTAIKKTAKGSKLIKGGRKAVVKRKDSESEDDYSPEKKKRKPPVKKETTQTKLSFKSEPVEVDHSFSSEHSKVLPKKDTSTKITSNLSVDEDAAEQTAAAKPKKASPATKQASPHRGASIKLEEDEDDEEDDWLAATARIVGKKGQDSLSKSARSFNQQDEEEGDVSLVLVKPKPKAQTLAKRATTKSKPDIEEDDNEFAPDSRSLAGQARSLASAPAATRAKRSAVTKKKPIVLSDSEEDEEDEASISFQEDSEDDA